MTTKVRIRAVGHATSLFLMLTFVLCVIFDLIFPQYAMFRAWQDLLPGFRFGDPAGFVIGLVETWLYGWYVALVWVPVYNAVAQRHAQ